MSERIAPGIWIDDDGDIHFSVPELLAHFGWPDTPDTRAAVLEGIRRASVDSGAAALVVQATCPGCGVSGLGPHAPACHYVGDFPRRRDAPRRSQATNRPMALAEPIRHLVLHA